MAASVSNSRLPCSRSFALIKDSMLQSTELPLADVLDCNHWQEIFDAHEIDFGNDEDAIYTPAITLGGDTVTQYVWSTVCVDAMILRDRDADENSSNGLEERIYVLHDANYNVTAIVDTSGNVLERYYYEAYGRAVYLDDEFALLPNGQSEHGWQHLHQGGRLDTITGNYHFRHRDLSHSLGRWINQDPIGFDGSPWNLYEYVASNPIRILDPNGLDLIYGPYDSENNLNFTPDPAVSDYPRIPLAGTTGAILVFSGLPVLNKRGGIAGRRKDSRHFNS